MKIYNENPELAALDVEDQYEFLLQYNVSVGKKSSTSSSSSSASFSDPMKSKGGGFSSAANNPKKSQSADDLEKRQSEKYNKNNYNDDDEEEEEIFSPGDSVLIKSKGKGRVSYFGPVHYSSGNWVGVTMEKPVGKNNGVIKGKEYFKCKENHGCSCPQL